MKQLNLVVLIASLVMNLLFLAAHAQTGLSTTSRKAAKAYESAEMAFRFEEYRKAEQLLKEAVDADPVFFEAFILLGELYEQTKADTNAIDAYRRAVEIAPDKHPAAYFYLASLEFSNGMYEFALTHYEAYLSYQGIQEKNRKLAKKNVLNCRFAIEALKNPVPFTPVNLGSNINTAANEYFPCLTADNQTLLFTRLVRDPQSYTGRQEDFYTSTRKENEWQLAKSIGSPINTTYNEGAPTLSADGNILIFTACESVHGYGPGRSGYGRCDLFISERIGASWSAPLNLGHPVNTRHWESQPSISSDGRSLYFVSNRDGYYNIYVTLMDEDGNWTEPEKLGKNINTDGYEGSVFIHPDNQTLYFSSDGHVGMGGLDIFMSRRDSTGEWGPPVNLGYPINTHRDENSILVSADGMLAMFASDREEGYGGLDLYAFDLYEEVRPRFVTYLKGIVYDEKTGEKLHARFELTDLMNGEVAVRSFSNTGSGEFLVSLPTDRDYALTVSKDGYLFFSENFNLSGVHLTSDPFLKDIPMKPIQAGETVVLKNIFFETDKFDLKESSLVELRKLLDFMNYNPGIRMEIGGHTDNVGTDEYNLRLSQNRAKAVHDYLISAGIKPERLVYKGYGSSYPIDSNELEEGRANNRRTEFKVID
jgi:flagellar motor protein MotB/tetratricopeptide (TPR) repeat protein